MTTSAEPTLAALEETRRRAHRHCVACGAAHPFGLHLEFVPARDGSVTAEIECRSVFEGYGGRLHGGIVATLLDAAMTHCLFAQGRTAVTGKLTVCFRHPVLVDQPVTVRAWVRRSSRPLYLLESELIQADEIKAKACAKFMEEPALADQVRPTS